MVSHHREDGTSGRKTTETIDGRGGGDTISHKKTGKGGLVGE